ncbi:MAG: hypothetical protein ABI380_11575 [Edaphobacter sp.]
MMLMGMFRMKRGFCLFLVALLAAGGIVQAQSVAVLPQAPATILIIRHAEKLTDGRVDLSEAGYKRAALMPTLFAGARADLPVPQVLFATHLSKHSNRPVETITPLAAALKLPIDSTIMDDDYAALAKELLGGKYAGKVVLVAWHHGKIPQLAVALGAQPPYTPWPDGQFDRIWRIDYKDGKATLRDLPQELLPGDSK